MLQLVQVLMRPLPRAQGTKVNSKGKEVPHGVRLYSIAASRYGDNFDGQTTSLCVRRATYWDPEMKADDPAKKGLCSNFLCDAKPGDEITMTGARRAWRACAAVRAQRVPPAGCEVEGVVPTAPELSLQFTGG